MVVNRQNAAALVAELIGTFTLTFAVLSVSKSAIGIPYFVGIGAGLVLAILVLVIGNASGAHVNPAVTFGMWSVRQINTLKAILYIVTQFMGAALAWKLYTYFIESKIPNIASTGFNWRIFIAEAVGTFIFLFGIAAAVYQKYEGGKRAATIGGSLAVGIILASVISNGVLNPAVALGIQSWSKEYVMAPLLGGLIGANVYSLLFAGETMVLKPITIKRTAVVTQKTRTTTKKVKPSKSNRKKK